MSGGLNKAFMDDPDEFLRTYPVDIYPFNGDGMSGGVNVLSKGTDDDEHIPEGMAEFDLDEDSIGLVRLRRFGDRPKAVTYKSHRIGAYWLPWNPGGTASVDFTTLNNDGAHFLFTSSLAGCRILMTDTGFHHISGQLSQQDRVQASDDVHGGTGRPRALSSSSGNTYGDGAFIVGYRAKKGIRRQRNGDWNFVAQSSTRNDNGRYEVTQTWLNGDLFEISLGQ